MRRSSQSSRRSPNSTFELGGGHIGRRRIASRPRSASDRYAGDRRAELGDLFALLVEAGGAPSPARAHRLARGSPRRAPWRTGPGLQEGTRVLLGGTRRSPLGSGRNPADVSASAGLSRGRCWFAVGFAVRFDLRFDRTPGRPWGKAPIDTGAVPRWLPARSQCVGISASAVRSGPTLLLEEAQRGHGRSKRAQHVASRASRCESRAQSALRPRRRLRCADAEHGR